MFTGRKLPLTLAFTVLVALAFGVSCRGFFPKPTIASFVINPTNPTVPLGSTLQMHAFGTDSNGNPTGDITSKITWSSKASGIISISTGGLLTGKTLSTSTVEIDGNYQALTQQSTNATVCVENGTNFQIVPSTSTPASGASFTLTATTDAPVGGVQTTVDITSSIVWTSGNTLVTITGGTDPVNATTGAATQNTPVLITAAYTCNGTTNTFTTTVTVQ
jgi:trimeric autotransporter adhesin